jgi:hypothetical protein
MMNINNGKREKMVKKAVPAADSGLRASENLSNAFFYYPVYTDNRPDNHTNGVVEVTVGIPPHINLLV